MKEMLRTLGSTRAPLILTVGGFIVLIISLLSPNRRGPSSLNLVYMDDNGESEGHGTSRRASAHVGGKVRDEAARVMSHPADLQPVVEKVGGMDVAWMLPRPSTAAGTEVTTRRKGRASTKVKIDTGAEADDVKGTAVLLHGCSHTHTDWFSLPEERRIVKLLLSRGYVALALKSQETCWASSGQRSLFMDSSSSSNWDLEHGGAAVKALLEKWQVQDKPTYVIGASSGGTFAMMLPTAVPISGVVVQISPGAPSSIETWLPTDPHETTNTAPVALVYMPKDESWASKENVESTARVLRERGHPVLTIACSVDVKFGPSYLSERLPERIPPASSAMVVTELVRLGQAVCEESPLGPQCRLTQDPRQLRSIATLADKGNQEVQALFKEPGMSAAVEESLNRLWGQHELTSEGAERWLAFLEDHGGKEDGGDLGAIGASDAQ